MSLNIGDILKITQNQSFLGQLLQNVYFYRVLSLPTPPEGETVYDHIVLRFNADVGIPMRVLQSTACNHTVYRVDNLTNGIDFSEQTINVPGTMGEEASPSYNALNFILRRSTALTRNGSKRVGGLGEQASNGNTCIIAAGTLAAYANAVADGLFTADALPVKFAEAVIVGRTLVPASDPPSYELDLSKINPIASAAFTAMSTQRSRKAGHGL